jgi:polar amino acid transport system substrate-binding protein
VAGRCDAGIIGIEAERAAKLDYTAPLVEADYTLLVPAGSPYQTLADADRPGVRIAAVRHHASTIALAKIIKHATLVYADTPAATFAIFHGGGADLFASLREVLRHYLERLPGLRLFGGRYGFNPIGMAVAKGHAARLAYLSGFVEDAKASGLVQRAIDRASWHGIRVAPPDT